MELLAVAVLVNLKVETHCILNLNTDQAECK